MFAGIVLSSPMVDVNTESVTPLKVYITISKAKKQQLCLSFALYIFLIFLKTFLGYANAVNPIKITERYQFGCFTVLTFNLVFLQHI